MAKVYQLALNAPSQANFDAYAHSLLFADLISPTFTQTEAGTNSRGIVVTSGVESADFGSGSVYELLADDSQSEISVDISSGKFVEGNLIAVWATVSEAQSDMRDFMTFYATSGDIHLHVGVCNTTQSQDYTPDIVANNRAVKMLTPSQVVSLGL
jgi:hypothetical protein|tara:strand:+ start:1341 stop:1805 length:465 start_codon:yes stop_codon:yes gene_type:complete